MMAIKLSPLIRKKLLTQRNCDKKKIVEEYSQRHIDHYEDLFVKLIFHGKPSRLTAVKRQEFKVFVPKLNKEKNVILKTFFLSITVLDGTQS